MGTWITKTEAPVQVRTQLACGKWVILTHGQSVSKGVRSAPPARIRFMAVPYSDFCDLVSVHLFLGIIGPPFQKMYTTCTPYMSRRFPGTSGDSQSGQPGK